MMAYRIFGIVAVLGSIHAFAQPAAPTGADLPCSSTPGEATVSIPAEDGFVKIFNGKDLTGWWNNCKTEDAASDRAKGGIMRADVANEAIYTQQRSNGGGSMLITNQKWGNHEIILEVWPEWGNDAGLFHRTTTDGRAFQTVIDYRSDNCIGGSYPQEMGYAFYNCSYTFTSEGVIGTGKKGNANVNRSTFKWDKMWNVSGWNELRVKMYGHPPKHQAWMRKVGEPEWYLVTDVSWPNSYITSNGMPATGHIALQIHYGNYWNKTGAGNWYRNIRIRELDNSGVPLVVAALKSPRAAFNGSLRAIAGGIAGQLDKSYRISIRDISGRMLERFSAEAGNFRHTLAQAPKEGVIFVELRSGTTAFAQRVVVF